VSATLVTPFPFAAVPIVLMLAASAAAPTAPKAPAAPAASPRGDGSAVHVELDTVVVDRRGTWSAGSDEADLIPGTTGVLKKAITLAGKDAQKSRETIDLETRITPSIPEPGGPACVLSIGVVVRRAGSAQARSGSPPIDRTLVTVSLDAGQERLLDAYASSTSGGRVALRVRCDEAKPHEDGSLAMITFDLSVERRAEGEQPEIVGDTRLVAAIGREAGTTVADHVTLPDGEGGAPRFRDEDLTISLSPGLLVAGRLQVEMTVTGRVSTMGRDGGAAIHPVEHHETWLLGPRESRTYDVVLPGDAGAEGWSDLHYRIDVRARF
jgi:hypothetical protein